jgi:GTP cyclohydrolase I
MSKEYKNQTVSLNKQEIEHHVYQILKLIGEDPDREGLIDTPGRVAKMYEEIFSGYYADYNEILGTTFEENHNELVIVSNITYYSVCEHHMAPFFGKVHIGYLPDGKVVGLSKLARLVDAVTRKLQVQERVTSEIANVLLKVLNAQGVMVVVEGEHLCMCSRGVKKPNCLTITSAVRGTFKDNPTLRSEFLNLIHTN